MNHIETGNPMQMMVNHPRLGVLLSGGGRTLQNLLDQIAAGKLNAHIAVVISSQPNVRGVQRAKDAGLPVVVIRRHDFADPDAFSDCIAQTLDGFQVDLACQAGWLCHWKLPQRWQGRALNIHPSLLPKYGGKGFYGHHVHEAVIAAGEQQSGCTVHFVTDEYDSGPIILRKIIPVLSTDTPDTLAERVFEQECIAYPEAIRLVWASMQQPR